MKTEEWRTIFLQLAEIWKGLHGNKEEAESEIEQILYEYQNVPEQFSFSIDNSEEFRKCMMNIYNIYETGKEKGI